MKYRSVLVLEMSFRRVRYWTLNYEIIFDVNIASDWNMRADPVTIWRGVCWVITSSERWGPIFSIIDNKIKHEFSTRQVAIDIQKYRDCGYIHWLSCFSFHLLATISDNEPPLTAFLLNTLNIDAVTFIYFT